MFSQIVIWHVWRILHYDVISTRIILGNSTCPVLTTATNNLNHMHTMSNEPKNVVNVFGSVTLPLACTNQACHNLLSINSVLRSMEINMQKSSCLEQNSTSLCSTFNCYRNSRRHTLQCHRTLVQTEVLSQSLWAGVPALYSGIINSKKICLW